MLVRARLIASDSCFKGVRVHWAMKRHFGGDLCAFRFPYIIPILLLESLGLKFKHAVAHSYDSLRRSE